MERVSFFVDVVDGVGVWRIGIFRGVGIWILGGSWVFWEKEGKIVEGMIEIRLYVLDVVVGEKMRRGGCIVWRVDGVGILDRVDVLGRGCGGVE